MIPPAQKTGRFTLITHAMAREVIVGKDGKAEGVSYIDKRHRTEKRVYARRPSCSRRVLASRRACC